MFFRGPGRGCSGFDTDFPIVKDLSSSTTLSSLGCGPSPAILSPNPNGQLHSFYLILLENKGTNFKAVFLFSPRVLPFS